MVQLVLVRHGESTANFDNTYTGWSDVELTDHGREQAHTAGRLIAASHIDFDAVHTSMLRRAIMTAYIIQDELHANWLPITKSWRLNERHYGALRGLNKDKTRTLFGPQQVAQWRRSYTAEPPHLARAHHQRRYAAWPTSIIPPAKAWPTRVHVSYRIGTTTWCRLYARTTTNSSSPTGRLCGHSSNTSKVLRMLILTGSRWVTPHRLYIRWTNGWRLPTRLY